MAIALSLDLELKVPAKQYWDTIRNPSKLFPKIMPTLFKSVEIIEGEEGNVGCVRLIKYGEDMQFLTFAKEKVEALDTTNMCVTYSLIEGELLGIFKVFKPTFKVTPLDDNSCIINWSVDIESAGENFPINVVTEMVKEIAANAFRAVEEHLLAPVA